MAYPTYTINQDVIAADIQSMAAMSESDYRDYLETGLIRVDHHDILRSIPAGYPIAVTREQFRSLISYLLELEPQIGDGVEP